MKAWRVAAALACVCAQALGCPADGELAARDLLGLWHAEFDGGRPAATLRLEPNPDWPGSVAGRLMLAGRQLQVAGDLEDGSFTLEESADGVRIDATWIGTPVQGRCGREIRGTWRAGEQDAGQGFVLRRQAGW